jgi:hypothetical protein
MMPNAGQRMGSWVGSQQHPVGFKQKKKTIDAVKVTELCNPILYMRRRPSILQLVEGVSMAYHRRHYFHRSYGRNHFSMPCNMKRHQTSSPFNHHRSHVSGRHPYHLSLSLDHRRFFFLSALRGVVKPGGRSGRKPPPGAVAN